MKIRCIDNHAGAKAGATEHHVFVTEDRADGFHFICADLPKPSGGRRYFLGSRHVEVSVHKSDSEDGREVITYAAVPI